MKALTFDQIVIINKLAELDCSQLSLGQPFIIAHKPPGRFALEWHNEYKDGFLYIEGYVKSAEGLRQRGLLIRDKGDCFYWLSSFGIEYIKGLQS